MDRSTVILLNPTAGRGRGVKTLERLKAVAESQSIPIWLTEGSAHATELARRATHEGFDVVAVAAGDGTVMHAVNGLENEQCALAIIPCGTGNDLARHFGFSRNPEDVLDLIQRAAVRHIDVGVVNGLRFLNICGVGFDAAVASRINRGFRRLRGTAAYVAAVLVELKHYRPLDLCIHLDDELIETDAMLCAIANTSSYGGGMRIAPEADATDGALEVVVVKGVSRGEFVRAFPTVFKGQHLSHPKVRHFRTTKARIGTDQPQSILVDGELAARTPAEFSVNARRLRLVDTRPR